MALASGLRKRIVDLLIPYMDVDNRKTFTTIVTIKSYTRIKLDMAAAPFTNALVDAIDKYDGRETLVTLLEELYESVGIEAQNEIDTIIRLLSIKDVAMLVPPPVVGVFQLIHTFHLGFTPVWATFNPRENTLWMSNYEQINVYKLDAFNLVASKILKDKPWKCLYDTIWQGGVVAADWFGNAYLFADKPRNLREIGDNNASLPFHLFAAYEEHLFGASWDGKLVKWDASQLATMIRIGQLDALPTTLIPVSTDELVVADQNGRLTAFTCIENHWDISWQWQSPHPIHSVWDATSSDTAISKFIVLTTTHHLFSIIEGGKIEKDLNLKKNVLAISHVKQAHTIIVFENNKAQLLTWEPFRLLRDPEVTFDFVPQQISAIPNATAAVLSALVLGADGMIYDIENHIIQPTGIMQDFDMVKIAPDGNLIIGIKASNVSVFSRTGRTCRLSFKSVSGKLKQGHYETLRVELVNSGETVIYAIRGELTHTEGIDGKRDVALNGLTLQHGETIDLDFQINMNVAGTAVPLVLKLDLEGGGAHVRNPEITFSVNVES